MTDIDPAATRPEWPGWTWSSFEHFWTERLTPVWYKPPFSVLARSDMIETAWKNPLSYEGMMLELQLSLFELADPARIQAAQKFGQAMSNKAGGAGFSIKGDPTMPALIVPGCFLVAIKGLSGGQDIVNVVGVRNSGGTALGAAQAVRDAWAPATGGPISQLTNLYVLDTVRAMSIDSVDGAIAEVSGINKAGVLTGSHATNGSTALIKWNGGTRNPSSRGRLYYGPLNEAQINPDGRTITTANLSAINTAFNAFRTSLEGAGYPLVVISRKNSTATTVTSSAVESVIATQRRRIRS